MGGNEARTARVSLPETGERMLTDVRSTVSFDTQRGNAGGSTACLADILLSLAGLC